MAQAHGVLTGIHTIHKYGEIIACHGFCFCRLSGRKGKQAEQSQNSGFQKIHTASRMIKTFSAVPSGEDVPQALIFRGRAVPGQNVSASYDAPRGGVPGSKCRGNPDSAAFFPPAVVSGTVVFFFRTGLFYMI